MILDMEFFRIALVGTPCSGKTAVLESLRNSMAKETEWRIRFIGEAATELMADSRNIALRQVNGADFQNRVALIQFSKEDEGFFEAVADGAHKYIQITDRALPDAYVYLSDEEREASGIRFPDIQGLYKRYDAVIFFDVYDRGADLLAGNALRAEKEKEQLYRLQDISLDVYGEHPTFFRVPTFDTLEDKAARAADIINGIVGERIFLY